MRDPVLSVRMSHPVGCIDNQKEREKPNDIDDAMFHLSSKENTSEPVVDETRQIDDDCDRNCHNSDGDGCNHQDEIELQWEEELSLDDDEDARTPLVLDSNVVYVSSVSRRKETLVMSAPPSPTSTATNSFEDQHNSQNICNNEKLLIKNQAEEEEEEEEEKKEEKTSTSSQAEVLPKLPDSKPEQDAHEELNCSKAEQDLATNLAIENNVSKPTVEDNYQDHLPLTDNFESTVKHEISVEEEERNHVGDGNKKEVDVKAIEQTTVDAVNNEKSKEVLSTSTKKIKRRGLFRKLLRGINKKKGIADMNTVEETETGNPDDKKGKKKRNIRQNNNSDNDNKQEKKQLQRNGHGGGGGFRRLRRKKKRPSLPLQKSKLDVIEENKESVYDAPSSAKEEESFSMENMQGQNQQPPVSQETMVESSTSSKVKDDDIVELSPTVQIQLELLRQQAELLSRPESIPSEEQQLLLKTSSSLTTRESSNLRRGEIQDEDVVIVDENAEQDDFVCQQQVENPPRQEKTNNNTSRSAFHCDSLAVGSSEQQYILQETTSSTTTSSTQDILYDLLEMQKGSALTNSSSFIEQVLDVMNENEKEGQDFNDENEQDKEQQDDESEILSASNTFIVDQVLQAMNVNDNNEHDINVENDKEKEGSENQDLMEENEKEKQGLEKTDVIDDNKKQIELQEEGGDRKNEKEEDLQLVLVDKNFSYDTKPDDDAMNMWDDDEEASTLFISDDVSDLTSPTDFVSELTNPTAFRFVKDLHSMYLSAATQRTQQGDYFSDEGEEDDDGIFSRCAGFNSREDNFAINGSVEDADIFSRDAAADNRKAGDFLSLACVTIQAYTRRWIAQRRCQEIMHETFLERNASTIQAYMRRWIEQRRYHQELQEKRSKQQLLFAVSAIKIQKAFLAHLLRRELEMHRASMASSETYYRTSNVINVEGWKVEDRCKQVEVTRVNQQTTLKSMEREQEKLEKASSKNVASSRRENDIGDLSTRDNASESIDCTQQQRVVTTIPTRRPSMTNSPEVQRKKVQSLVKGVSARLARRIAIREEHRKNELEKKEKKRLNAVITIQAYVRRWLAENHFWSTLNEQEQISAAITIQSHARRWIAKRFLIITTSAPVFQSNTEATNQNALFEESAIKIQTAYRGYLAVMSVYSDIVKVIMVQNYVRMKQAKTRVYSRMASVVKVQAIHRGRRVRQTIEKDRDKAIKIQTAWRCCVARLKYQIDRLDVIVIQSLVRQRQAKLLLQQKKTDRDVSNLVRRARISVLIE